MKNENSALEYRFKKKDIYKKNMNLMKNKDSKPANTCNNSNIRQRSSLSPNTIQPGSQRANEKRKTGTFRI